jgi:hypothetical protein
MYGTRTKIFEKIFFGKKRLKLGVYLEVNWQLTTSSNPTYPELDRNQVKESFHKRHIARFKKPKTHQI